MPKRARAARANSAVEMYARCAVLENATSNGILTRSYVMI